MVRKPFHCAFNTSVAEQAVGGSCGKARSGRGFTKLDRAFTLPDQRQHVRRNEAGVGTGIALSVMRVLRFCEQVRTRHGQ